MSALGQKQTFAVQNAMSALANSGHSLMSTRCLLYSQKRTYWRDSIR